MRSLNRFERIFLKVVKAYVKRFPHRSFLFTFDTILYPQIGSSDDVIEVHFRNSPDVFRRIFSEGSLGFGESYCNGNILIKNDEENA